MTRVLASFLAVAFTIGACAVAPTSVQADDYWKNYWGWYDNNYRPYYHRYYSRRPNYGYGGYYNYPNYGYRDYGYRDWGRNYGYRNYGYPNYSGGHIQIGPYGFSWR